MNLKLKKNSQISIFIIISISIIVLFIFLFSSNSNQNKNNLDKIKNSIISETNQKLFPLKENVDFCLEKQLKKALIISGMKGGFIYNKGEYYSNSAILSDTYKNSLINNLGLNWNNLIGNVLIYFQSKIYVPGINNNGTIYSHTINEDYEKFILNGFLKCIDLNRYENAGYKITKEEYSDFISSTITDKTAKVLSIIGSIGDKVKISISGKDYIGKITKVDSKLNFIIISFKNPIFNNVNSNIDYSTIMVRNLDSKIKVIVKFNEENVESFLYFPISIKRNNFSTSYKESDVKVNIRFKKYLDLAKLLLREKSDNRKLNYSNINDVRKVLNKSEYFRTTPLKNFQIIETKLNNSIDYKKYVYTIVDKDSSIYGNPYIFNFAYENNAPKIDLSKLGTPFFSDNQVLFITAQNILFKMNIKKLVTDKQFFDNYNFSFIPKSSSSALYSYSLDKFGNLSFITSIKNRFSFNIEVTDGEAINNQQFVFVSGFPENIDNSDAINCLSFENFENKLFPINLKYNNKIFNFTDSNGKIHLYSYMIANQIGTKLPYDKIKNSKIKISNSCLGVGGSFNLFDIKVEYKNLVTGIVSPLIVKNNEILIPKNIINPIEVSILIFSKGTTKLVNKEPFKIEIYPTKCLGPNQFDLTDQNKFDGLGSCCDISKISTQRINSPSGLINNLLNLNQNAINISSYFIFNLNSSGIFPSSYNYENKIIWNDFGNDITSLYEGNIVSKCGGIFPKFENNIIGITTNSKSDYTNNVKSFYTNNNLYNKGIDFTNIPINLKIVKQANRCEFSQIQNYSDLNILTNDNLILDLGYKFLNPLVVSNYVGFIPTTPNYDNIFVLCNNNFYSSNKTIPNTFKDWVNGGNVGKGGVPGTVHTSKGYCQQGNNKCSGRINSNTKNKFDDVSNCVDYSVKNGKTFIKNKNQGWVCGSYNKPICDKTIPSNSIITYVKKNLICDGTSFSCPNSPNFSLFSCP